VGCFVLPVVFVGLLSPPSYSGACYLLALVLMWLGPGLSRWRIVRALSVSARNRARWVGVVLFVVTLCVRMFTGSSEGLRYEQVGERSLLRAAFARLANERDLSGGAWTLLRTFSMLPERGDRLATLFRDTYDQMDAADENPASPLLPTLLFGQSPESFDMLRYHVGEPRPSSFSTATAGMSAPSVGRWRSRQRLRATRLCAQACARRETGGAQSAVRLYERSLQILKGRWC
jgi:hypothetical protein